MIDDEAINIGINCTIQEQCSLLEKILWTNKDLFHVISTIGRFGLNNYYVAGGCISQTVWNYQLKNEVNFGISDIDVIYFDKNDLFLESEKQLDQEINDYYSDIKIDVKNEARVHLWYHEKFGVNIPPYISSESAINSWIPATAIGVKYKDDAFYVYAPYGLNDMFSRTIRPNKLLATQQHYEEKTMKWQRKWNDIKVINW